METTASAKPRETLRTLPGDDVRQIMWRYQDRYDLQMLVQAARGVARGLVARLVAQGAPAAVLDDADLLRRTGLLHAHRHVHAHGEVHSHPHSHHDRQ